MPWSGVLVGGVQTTTCGAQLGDALRRSSPARAGSHRCRRPAAARVSPRPCARVARQAHRLPHERDVAEFRMLHRPARCPGARPAGPRTSWSMVWIGPQGTPAFSSRSVHSAVVRVEQGAADRGVDARAIGDPLGVGAEAGLADQVRQVQRLAQPRPHRLADGGDVEIAVAASGTRRSARSADARCRAGPAPCRRSATARPGSRASRSAIRAARSAPTGLRRDTSRSSSAVRMPMAQKWPAHRSASGMPTRIGPSSGLPVTLISPPMPWAMESKPGQFGIRPVLAEARDAGVDQPRD